MSKPSQFIVLAEDERHQRFVRKLLHRLYGEPQIRNVDLPSSRGCGEQWVRKHYTAEVRAYRERSAKARTALIVVMDADTCEVGWRLKQLHRALEEAGLPGRAGDEVIVHYIPKRNIETWILCLTGNKVDEITDYSRQKDIDDLIPPAALAMFDWSRANANVPEYCIPSLSTAIAETGRLR